MPTQLHSYDLQTTSMLSWFSNFYWWLINMYSQTAVPLTQLISSVLHQVSSPFSQSIVENKGAVHLNLCPYTDPQKQVLLEVGTFVSSIRAVLF